ncbi:MAG: VOC family protein [Candidatus Cloacimonadales bacterium]
MSNLHHVEIYVSDLARSKQFWSWFLEKMNYQLYQEWPQGFSYKYDETYLVFVQTEKRFLQQPYHRCTSGLNHLAFWVESPKEVDDWRDKLREQGVKLLYDEKYPFAGGEDYYACYFEDPDRIKLELVARKQK